MTVMSQPRTICARAAVLTGALLAVVACARTRAPVDAQFVAQWMRTTLAFVRNERLGAPVASRISAYTSIAIFEGYASDSRTSLRSLSAQLNGLAALPTPPDPRALDGATVAAEAVRVVLDSLLRDGMPGTRRTLDSLAEAQVAQRANAGVASSDVEASLRHGRLIATTLLEWAATDSFFATRGRAWTLTGRRGEWVNTANVSQFVPQTLSGQSDLVQFSNPEIHADAENVTTKGTFANRPKLQGPTTLPAFNPTRPTEPYWGHLRPFVLASGNECAPPPPPQYSEAPGSAFYQMGKQFHDSVRALTPSQRGTALFWADNPVATGTPGFHWISVLSQMVSRRQLTADQSAELYALTSIGIADAFISCWREKYRSLVVRPETWVRRVLDAKFTTAIATPPFPEYTSGHSVQSAAAVEILISALGDTIPFIDSTQTDIGQAPRKFASFSAALSEVAVSRVYAGVHYFPAVQEGLTQGRCIARRVRTLITRRTQ